MSNEMIDTLNKQFEQVSVPARKFMELNLAHTEKLVQFQIDASRQYVNLGLDQARSALEISDAEGFKTWLSKQRDVAETVAKRIGEDTRTVVDFGRNYAEEAASLTQEGAKVARKAAPKSASKKSA